MFFRSRQKVVQLRPLLFASSTHSDYKYCLLQPDGLQAGQDVERQRQPEDAQQRQPQQRVHRRQGLPRHGYQLAL